MSSDATAAAARKALSAFTTTVPGLLPEWTVSFGDLTRSEEAPEVWSVVVHLKGRNGQEILVPVGVWSQARDGQMDPETSADIAASSLLERLDTQRF